MAALAGTIFLSSFNLCGLTLVGASSYTLYLPCWHCLPIPVLPCDLPHTTCLPQQELLQRGSCPVTPSRQPQPDLHHSKATPDLEWGLGNSPTHQHSCKSQPATLGANPTYQHAYSSCNQASQPLVPGASPAHQWTCNSLSPVTAGEHIQSTQETPLEYLVLVTRQIVLLGPTG